MSGTEQGNPDIGRSVQAGRFLTNYHDEGDGAPLVLLHGSGPGVSAWANWRANISVLAQDRRVIAPDIVGFGFTERPAGATYNMPLWLTHLRDFLNALEVEQVELIGNSFGGALSIAFAIAYPERVRKLVLMGAAGLDFPLTTVLDAVWGYEPSVEAMAAMMRDFAYDQSLVTDELAQLRYQASLRPGVQEAFSAMFPAPRQDGVRMLASPEADIAKISVPTLIIHGREDRALPPDCSRRLFELIPDAELHMFGRCGHWTQIEKRDRFNALVRDFLNGDRGATD